MLSILSRQGHLTEIGGSYMVRTVTITKELLDNIKEVYLHDAEVKEIMCNYFEHKITIPLVLELPNLQMGTGLLIFNDVAYSEISYHEPWGMGHYINGINADKGLNGYTNFFDINDVDYFNSLVKDKNCFNITIELNSGDLINIVASEMTYTEDIKSTI